METFGESLWSLWRALEASGDFWDDSAELSKDCPELPRGRQSPPEILQKLQKSIFAVLAQRCIDFSMKNPDFAVFLLRKLFFFIKKDKFRCAGIEKIVFF